MDNALLELVTCSELILATTPDASQIPIGPLLELFNILKRIVSALGMLFGFAADDIGVKCQRVREICTRAGLMQATVNTLIAHEKEKKTIETDAIRNLLPLIRSMEFVSVMLNSLNGPKELGECLRESYYSTLYKHHNYFVVSAVIAASWTVPTKENFFAVLGVKTTRALDLCNQISPKLDLIYKGLKGIYEEENIWNLK